LSRGGGVSEPPTGMWAALKGQGRSECSKGNKEKNKKVLGQTAIRMIAKKGAPAKGTVIKVFPKNMVEGGGKREMTVYLVLEQRGRAEPKRKKVGWT